MSTSPESPVERIIDSIAYHVPRETFLFKKNGKWQMESPLSKDGIRRFMVDHGVDREIARDIIKNESYANVYGIDSEPHGGTFVETDGLRYLNVWAPPTLAPAPGVWPRIEKILYHLCDGSDEAVEHLVNWLAYKVQNPGAIPRTAIVFGTSQGGGKGTLFKIMAEMLGPDNCVELEQNALESRFNGMWGGKLLCLGNEVVNSDNAQDISERLKILIDSPRVTVERKGIDSYTIKNVTAWIFATNATTGGVKVESGDRRFNILTNFAPIDPAYRTMTLELFGPGGHGWSEEGKSEVAAFYSFLLDLEVDKDAVGRPLQNAARDAIIEASVPFHELFKRDVTEHGIDPYIKELMDRGNYQLSRSKLEWDFGAEGVGIDVVYEAYVNYTQSKKGMPLKAPKFRAAMEAGHPQWKKVRLNVPGTNNTKKATCYVVKREVR